MAPGDAGSKHDIRSFFSSKSEPEIVDQKGESRKKNKSQELKTRIPTKMNALTTQGASTPAGKLPKTKPMQKPSNLKAKPSNVKTSSTNTPPKRTGQRLLQQHQPVADDDEDEDEDERVVSKSLTKRSSPRRQPTTKPSVVADSNACRTSVPSSPKSKTTPTPSKSPTEHSNEDETPAKAMSDYEMARLKNIQINHARLAALGLNAETPVLFEGAEKTSDTNKKNKKKEKRVIVEEEPSRRSKRTRGEQPDYTNEKIDKFGDALDVMAGRTNRNVTSAPRASRQIDEIIGDAREMFLKARNQLAAKTNVDTTAVVDGDGWFKRAVDLWGTRVTNAKPPSWEKYVLSRLSNPPPESPYLLLQEIYAPDVWKLLVACTLMSRVSSAETKHKCLGGFFERYPNASAALDADPRDVHTIIGPLGLFENRIKCVLAVSERFLEMDEFDCGMEKETKIYGIGEFGVDSFRIFCKNEGREMTPSDRNLNGFCTWLKTQPITMHNGYSTTQHQTSQHHPQPSSIAHHNTQQSTQSIIKTEPDVFGVSVKPEPLE